MHEEEYHDAHSPHMFSKGVAGLLQEQFQDAKVLIFKKRRRKNSRRLKGHRQVKSRAAMELHLSFLRWRLT